MLRLRAIFNTEQRGVETCMKENVHLDLLSSGTTTYIYLVGRFEPFNVC